MSVLATFKYTLTYTLTFEPLTQFEPAGAWWFCCRAVRSAQRRAIAASLYSVTIYPHTPGAVPSSASATLVAALVLALGFRRRAIGLLAGRTPVMVCLVAPLLARCVGLSCRCGRSAAPIRVPHGDVREVWTRRCSPMWSRGGSTLVLPTRCRQKNKR
eukprot:SAG25_NODE_291_length_10320_cov_2.259219_6_plen_158_part_00